MKSYDELKALIEQRGVHAEFGDAGEGWGIEQNPHELATFLVRMQELGVSSCLEIGTGYKGGLSRFLAHDLHWNVTTYDIQSYGHVFTGVHYIVGKQPIFDRQFDLVFIDGDHSYDAVNADMIKYRSSATKVIAFHDLLGRRDCMGVRLFWTEFKNSIAGKYMKNFEIWDYPENAKSAGIGWIEK